MKDSWSKVRKITYEDGNFLRKAAKLADSANKAKWKGLDVMDK